MFFYAYTGVTPAMILKMVGTESLAEDPQSSGIGEATARLLASKGAKVLPGARRADRLEKIVAEIRPAGCTAECRIWTSPASRKCRHSRPSPRRNSGLSMCW
jgi:hypothetical protein